MSTLGVVHTVFAFLAILAGAVVCLLPKGTRWHRSWGHLYGTSMLGLVVSALFLYRLTGSVTPFHVFAVVAGVTVVAGLGSVLLRRPRKHWVEAHANWMSWSYVGLLAAFAAESLTRFVLPLLAPSLREHALWGAFWTLVALASLLVVAVGGWILRRHLPEAIEGARPDRRRHSAGDGG